MKYLQIIFLSFLFSQLGNTQQIDEVLFTVDGEPVYESEFEYIFNKTNAQNVKNDVSLQEHLELYKKFKLKVRYARDQKVDESESMKKELYNYKKQLTDAFFMDREVIEKMAKTIHQRKQFDVETHHIYFALNKNANDSMVNAVYEKANMVKEKLAAGADFTALALQYSEDPSVNRNKGRMGYLNAMLPNGFHTIEDEIYSLKKGEWGGPVRSKVGLHLVKVTDIRKARGKIEAAHIFIRDSAETPNSTAQQRINEAYQKLVAGESFEIIAALYSEDKNTKNNKGYLGTFGINKFEKVFEDAAFAIKKDGAFTQPIKSKTGWHIIKRLTKPAALSFDQAKLGLIEKLKNDQRVEEEKTRIIETVKKDEKLSLMESNVETYMTTLPDSYTTYKWRENKTIPDVKMFKMGNNSYSTHQFETFARDKTRDRLTIGREFDKEQTARQLFEMFIDEMALNIYEEKLPEQYPELKALLREYEEGILLFEITQQNVWQKANDDTLGLKTYWEENIKGTQKYMWKPRASVVFYEIAEGNEKLIPKIRKWSTTKTSDFINKKVNVGDTKKVTIMRKTFEKGQNEDIDNLKWEPNFLSSNQKNSDKATVFTKVEKIIPPSEKELKDIRGYVVAAYQGYLEEMWLQKLNDLYEVKVDEAVFQKLLKKYK